MPWTPASLGAPLLGWWKADAGLTLSGSNVTSWADSSGNGLTMTGIGSGGNTPTATLTLNSLPVVSFASAHLQSFVTAANAVALGVATASVFGVYRYNVAGTFGRFFNFIGTGQAHDYDNNSSFVSFINGSTSVGISSNSNASIGPTALNTWFEFGGIFDGANITAYINNSAQAPAAFAGTLGAAGTSALGCDFVNDGQLDGDIAEVFLTNTALSPTDIGNIHTYFQSKWFGASPPATPDTGGLNIMRVRPAGWNW